MPTKKTKRTKRGKQNKPCLKKQLIKDLNDLTNSTYKEKDILLPQVINELMKNKKYKYKYCKKKYLKPDLIKLCDEKKIKYNKKATKNELLELVMNQKNILPSEIEKEIKLGLDKIFDKFEKKIEEKNKKEKNKKKNM